MIKDRKDNSPVLNRDKLDLQKKKALEEKCVEQRALLSKNKPEEIARFAALSLYQDENNAPFLLGDHYLDTHRISWPSIAITDKEGNPVSLNVEALWLHYMNRADGFPLAGRWVNLSEIGGLFYQQSFQGYCGDALAEFWGADLEGLKEVCLKSGGWPLMNLTDLAFEWRALPRLPLCLCYRKAAEKDQAWATILFDASANHYVAADVAAIVGKALADRLMHR